MHATSAVAVAVVAAAGALAFPMNSGIFAREMASSPAIPADPSLAAPGNAFGQAPSVPANEHPHDQALPFVTVSPAPEATAAKPDETPSAERNHHNKNKGSHHAGGHHHEGHNHGGHNRGDHIRAGHHRGGHIHGGHNHEGHHHAPHNHNGHNGGSHNHEGAHQHGGHGDHLKHETLPDAPSPVLPQPNGPPAPAPSAISRRALVERYADLLERYFNDLDELD